MMKKTVILYTLLLISFHSEAQNSDNLYLISGHPYKNTDEEFTSYLWHYFQNSLDTVSQLSSENDFLKDVKVYQGQNLAVIHKTSSIRRRHLGDNHRFILIEFKDSTGIREIPLKYEGLLRFSLLGDRDKIACYFFNEDYSDSRKFVSVDLESFEIEHSGIESFRYSILTGEPGGIIDSQDHLVVYSDKGSGLLEIPFHGDRDKRPKFPYEMPKEHRFEAYRRQLVPLNNEKIFVVGGERKTEKKIIGAYELKILDKKQNEWHSKFIKGNLVRIRGFGEWIGGYVFNDHIEGKKLPGSEQWTARESGLSPAERWGLYRQNFKYAYAPGILYFYNAFTKEYFELVTNQADSEVILIQDDTVIYRAYDELYSAKIINGKKLSQSQLLLKDDRVPDIHWAFFGGK